MILIFDHPYPSSTEKLPNLRFQASHFSIQPEHNREALGNFMKGRNSYVIQTMDAFNGKLPISFCPILFCPSNPLDN